jgi:hypothetical protein
MLLLPAVVALGFAFSWSNSRIPVVRPHPPEIAYSHP